MNISQINKYKKFTQYGKSGSSLDTLSERYSQQYNESISHFDVIINSDRADIVSKNGAEYKCIIDYGRLPKKSNLGNAQLKYHKEIMTKYSDNICAGDIVNHKSKHSGETRAYLILKTVETRDGYRLGVMHEVNGILKWIDDNGMIQSHPCVFEYNTRSNFGVDEDRIMTLPDGRRQVAVTMNEDTSKLKRDRRFIIDNQAFRIIDSDGLSDEGLFNISLQSDLVKPDVDNLELGIADYAEPNVEISIVNGNTLSLQVGETVQLLADVKNNGNTITSSVEWHTSDPLIAAVDETGLLSALESGSVTITAELRSDEKISASVTVDVGDAISNNYSIQILSASSSPNEIKLNQSKNYQVKVYNNSEIASASVNFELFAEDQISVTSKALIVSQDGSICTVKNNSTSDNSIIWIKASMSEDTFAWHKIQLKPLF